MKNKHKRASSNLRMLEIVARKLGNLNDEIVYLGGCTTALFITDPLSLDVRSTLDVDCIIDVISLVQYQKFEKQLKEKGFYRSMNDDVICRWHFDDIILDVMPTDEKILGWGNYWYKEAMNHAISHQITEDLCIKSVTAPYFLATKIEAFKSRGNNDFLGSHDFEDIITVIAGCVEIGKEVQASNDNLKKHLQSVFCELLENDQFIQSLPGHVSDGPVTMQRVQTVIERIKKITA
ncbi:hypothetical protein SFA91_01860 [Legionella pneumophila]|uniref:hypothetical protein n=1 Tax=Legionella pneumophila TaxID=446 RepID=UPI001E5DC31C|nr:hypothetical protein [Legionella pneumophila]MDW8868826.1 hypothetical protein [Legionella pneumophila]MDW8914836.1 hypothetical protein [Legionella pneumophila]MDW8924856.1 hypothetical protein [Legionella pneumophila]MDW8930382.1 hypothetical protein [Legionella pneumophila]MDW8933079.1 hypothetical protein [Legionella pneumophila]